MTAPIPTTIDDVTPGWLAEATGLPITTATATQIGVGIGVSSALYRVAIDVDPGSLVVKLPALDEAAVFTSSVLRMYIRECRFFTELADASPVRVPSCHFTDVDEETSRFVVVMEDLGGMRVVDQVEGMAIADAERAVDELAAWHAAWWGKGDGLAADGLTVSLADPIYPAILPMVWAEGWEKVTSSVDVPAPIERVGPRWPEVFARLLSELAAGPNTMTHGDYRADNILLAPDGSVALLDFQLIGTGSAAYDLAYFVTQSLDPEVASANEQALFTRWLDGLRAGGVPERDLDRMWEDYRKAALFCLVYPIVASRGMDLSDARQRGLVECMNGRFSRAVDELSLEDLL